MMKNLVFAFSGGVGESHILKFDRLVEASERGCVGALFHIVFSVEKGKDRGRSSHRLLKGVVEISKPAQGIVELKEQKNERAEGAYGHVAVFDLVASDPQQQRHGHCSDGVHQRRTDGLNAHTAQIGAEEPLGGALESQNLPQLGVECFHDAVAR